MNSTEDIGWSSHFLNALSMALFEQAYALVREDAAYTVDDFKQLLQLYYEAEEQERHQIGNLIRLFIKVCSPDIRPEIIALASEEN